MKKLLFIGLISLGVLQANSYEDLVRGTSLEGVAQEVLTSEFTLEFIIEFLQDSKLDRPDIYLFEYFNGKEDEAHYALLDSLQSIDCEKINALSEEDFSILIKKALSYNVLYITTSDGLLQVMNTQDRIYRVLTLIHQCRSIYPVINGSLKEKFLETYGSDFEGLVRLIQVRHESLTSECLYARDRFFYALDNIENLRKERAEK